jgi:hypothetical protein
LIKDMSMPAGFRAAAKESGFTRTAMKGRMQPGEDRDYFDHRDMPAKRPASEVMDLKLK